VSCVRLQNIRKVDCAYADLVSFQNLVFRLRCFETYRIADDAEFEMFNMTLSVHKLRLCEGELLFHLERASTNLRTARTMLV
jgi:hypothetical protein